MMILAAALATGEETVSQFAASCRNLRPSMNHRGKKQLSALCCRSEHESFHPRRQDLLAFYHAVASEPALFGPRGVADRWHFRPRVQA
jgi:hypothetical protein